LYEPQASGLRWHLTGEAEHEVERCRRPRPVRGNEIGSAASQDVAQREGDDDGVVEVARDGDEVGDEVERHEQVGDQGGEDERQNRSGPMLLASREHRGGTGS